MAFEHANAQRPFQRLGAEVKLHTGRLDYSAANDVMIGRLEKILAGELTDIDKRYYTHEIRELERYRAIGGEDGPVPDEIKDEVWNNAHTATLEGFQLDDDWRLFYTIEADAADIEWLDGEC